MSRTSVHDVLRRHTVREGGFRQPLTCGFAEIFAHLLGTGPASDGTHLDRPGNTF